MSSTKFIDLRAKKSLPKRTAPRQPSKPLPQGPRLKKDRRRRKFILALFGILLAVIIAIEISYISYLPQFTVRDIRISGAEAVPANLVKLYVDAKLHDAHNFIAQENILRFNGKSLASGIEDFFPRVQRATVSRDSLLSSVATITLTERTPYAKWCGEECFFLDQNGFIFARDSDQSTTTTQLIFRGGLTLPEHAIGANYLRSHFGGIKVLMDSLGSTGLTPTGATALDRDSFSISLAEGFKIIASFGAEVNTMVSDVKLVLGVVRAHDSPSNLEYLDVRMKGHGFYVLKGAAVSLLKSATTSAATSTRQKIAE